MQRFCLVLLLCGLRFTHELLHKDMSWSCNVRPGELTERVCERPQLSATDPKESNIASSEAKESLKNETVSVVASRSIASAKRLFQSPNLSSIEPPEKPISSSRQQGGNRTLVPRPLTLQLLSAVRKTPCLETTTNGEVEEVAH